MKLKIILFVITNSLLSTLLFAQVQQAHLYLRILDKNHIPIPHATVYLNELESGEEFVVTSDNNAKVHFAAIKGYTYNIKVQDSEKVTQIKMPSKGLGTIARDIICEMEQNFTILTDTVIVDGKHKKPDRTTTAVGIQVLDINEMTVKDMPVTLFCKQCNKVWRAKTNKKGEAWFNVPIGSFLLVSVNDFPAYRSMQLPDKMGLNIRKSIRFQKMQVDEKLKNDTVIQHNTLEYEMCTERVLVDIELFDLQNNQLADEWVYFDSEKDNRVFAAKTNNSGKVKLLLPKGEAFIMNLTYERDIDLFNYPVELGLHSTEIQMNYIGTTTVEEHYKKTRRDSEGFITEFLNSEVHPIVFDQERYITTDYGFKIEAGSQKHNATPAIFKDQLIFSGGYYQKELFSISAEGGHTNWALGLSDNGPSSIIIHKNYIIIITESCSLYIIEANSGQLAWSKWLGPDIYSTPSAYGNTVFAVYPNKLARLSHNIFMGDPENFVLVAFDLESGDIKWQSWLDDEVLASPVPTDSGVFLTTMAGTVYKFDLENGEKLYSKKLNATTPPTFADDELYVSVISDNKTSVARLNPENLELNSKILNITDTLTRTKFRQLHASQLMGYTGSRTFNYENLNYNVIGNQMVCWDKKTGETKWKRYIDENQTAFFPGEQYMPSIINKMLAVPRHSGGIALLSAETGEELHYLEADLPIVSQTVVNGNVIYGTAPDGQLVAIKTKWNLLKGWNSWNGNAANNSSYKD